MRHRRLSTILRLLLSLIIAIALGLATSSTPVHAAACEWTGNTDTDWDTAGNWTSCNSSTPGSSDTVTIPNVTSDPILGSNTTIAGLTINSGAQLTINSGFTLTVDGATSLAGTLTGAGDLTVTVSGMLTWSGGTMSGSGVTNANGGLTLRGGSRTLDVRTLNNPGIATWIESDIWLINGAIINNSGTWNVQALWDPAMRIRSSGPYATFNNSGSLQKSGSNFVGIEANFNNSGSVNVQEGELVLGDYDLGSPSTSTSTGGTFTVASGAELTFNGNHSLDGSSSISGAGRVEFDNGGIATINCPYNVTGSTTVGGSQMVVNFNIHPTSLGSSMVVYDGTVNFNAAGTLNVAIVTLSGGTLNLTPDLNVTTYNQPYNPMGTTLTGSGTVTVSGLTTWSGGSMEGSGVTNANGGLTLGGNNVHLSTRTLNNAGTATWTAGDIGLNNGATINNSGTWDVQTDSYLTNLDGSLSIFNNSGVFQKTAGTGSTMVSIDFDNSGSVDAQVGSLRFGYDLTNNSGGAVEIGKDAALTVEGTLINNGVLTQTLAVDGGGLVEFLHITNSDGDSDKYRGVIIDTASNMGDTTVSIWGNQTCSMAGSLGNTVKRCYEIDPTTSQTATVTFYYLDSEANGNPAPDVYHWNGSNWDPQTIDGRDTSYDPNWVRASGISSYSPFAPLPAPGMAAAATGMSPATGCAAKCPAPATRLSSTTAR